MRGLNAQHAPSHSCTGAHYPQKPVAVGPSCMGLDHRSSTHCADGLGSTGSAAPVQLHTWVAWQAACGTQWPESQQPGLGTRCAAPPEGFAAHRRALVREQRRGRGGSGWSRQQGGPAAASFSPLKGVPALIHSLMARHDGSLAPISWRAQAPNTSCQRPKTTCAVEERCWRNFTVASHLKHPQARKKAHLCAKQKHAPYWCRSSPAAPLERSSRCQRLFKSIGAQSHARAKGLACWPGSSAGWKERTGQDNGGDPLSNQWITARNASAGDSPTPTQDTQQPSSPGPVQRLWLLLPPIAVARVGAHWNFSDHICSPLPVSICSALLLGPRLLFNSLQPFTALFNNGKK